MQSIPLQEKQTQAHIRENSFIRSVYNWMAIGLALTGFVAFYTAHSEFAVKLVFGNPLVFWGLVIGELGLVFSLSARVHKMEASTATGLFLIYSALNGITLSAIFLMYTGASIISTFFICAATFTICSIYGMVTKKDLTSLGGFMFMGLLGIIIASVVNWFFKSPAVNAIISYVGVIVFVGLTAYDTQKLKQMSLTQPNDIGTAAIRKGAIIGALMLYLDFINLFLMLLRIFGGSRD